MNLASSITLCISVQWVCGTLCNCLDHCMATWVPAFCLQGHHSVVSCGQVSCSGRRALNPEP